MNEPAKCRKCGSAMVWAKMPSGKLNPLDAEPVGQPEAKKGQFAFNPRTGHAVAVTMANVEDAARWVARGATLHLSHWATCVDAAQMRLETDERNAR